MGKIKNKYKITITFESDIDLALATQIADDCFVQLETIEDEEYGVYANANYTVERVKP